MMPVPGCQNYVPQVDPAKCVSCGKRWNEHHKDVRSTFTNNTTDGIIRMMEHRLSYLNQSSPERCTQFRPVKYGEDVIICECGRLLSEHNLRTIVRKAMTSSPAREIPIVGTVATTPIGKPCGHFVPEVDNPAHCKWCKFVYIAHGEEARGLDLENMTHLHATHCRSIVNIGSSCSCMSDTVKQGLLNSMRVINASAVKHPALPELGVTAGQAQPHQLNPVQGCNWFRALHGDSQNSQMCECGRAFYTHTVTACDGFRTWTEWRATRMTNEDCIAWFLKCGINDKARMEHMKHHLVNPNYMDPEAPSPRMIREMWDMLPQGMKDLAGKFKVKPLKGAETVAHATAVGTTETPSIIGGVESAAPVVLVDLPARTTCFSCADPLKPGEESICKGCVSQLADPGSAPWVARKKPSVPGVLHTEASINRDGGWETDHFD